MSSEEKRGQEEAPTRAPPRKQQKTKNAPTLETERGGLQLYMALGSRLQLFTDAQTDVGYTPNPRSFVLRQETSELLHY